jgi:hypothetical protein
MIRLRELSEEARGILVKAIPANQRFTSRDEDFVKLYQDFMKETNYAYAGEGSFDRFQLAVLTMKRKMGTLYYKSNIEEIMEK